MFERLKSSARRFAQRDKMTESDDKAPLPRLVAEPWYVDRIEINDHRVAVSGWSMPPDPLTKPAQGWFLINGLPFDHTSYPLPRADVGEVFWQRQGAAMSGYECSIDNIEQIYPGGVLEIRRVNPRTPEIERGRDAWFIPDPASHTHTPDEDQRFRVIGNRDLRGFFISGATDYRRLDHVLQCLRGKRLHQFNRVLDWGVGCGRIARHFPKAYAASLVGCDIDHDNVEWCRSHLPGTYLPITATAPLPFPDSTFDLVYGVSVFTHFGEATQLRWLDELRRISMPGATLLMTIHGRTALDFGRLPREEYWRLCEQVNRKGILVSGANAQLDGHADHGGEYVNVYHSAAYIRDTWSRYFQVEHILPGYLLHQDLVVLRKR